jgi:hypothetical protein
VNDDGLALLSDEEKKERINFWRDNDVAWVARPKNNDNGYIRKGKFKKASNMNFALNVANKVEDELLSMLTDTLEKTDMIDPVEEDILYHRAMDRVLASDPRIKAGGDIRMGEIILIVDSDTRVVSFVLVHIRQSILFGTDLISSLWIACSMVLLRCILVLRSLFCNIQPV